MFLFLGNNMYHGSPVTAGGSRRNPAFAASRPAGLRTAGLDMYVHMHVMLI